MAGDDDEALTLADVRQRCEDYEDHLLAAGETSDEVLARFRPGGAQNPARGAIAWLWYYGHLRILLHGQSEGGAGTAADDALAAAVLAEHPGVLVLARPDAAGEPITVQVYPKSYLTLLDCHDRHLRLRWLAERLEALGQDASAEALECATRCLAEVAYQQQVLAWIATTAGPGLPYDTLLTPPLPPETFGQWHPVDFIRLNQVYHDVNRFGLEALDRLLAPPADSPKSDGFGLSWSPFFAALAHEMGVSSVVLMRDRALASLLATVRLAADARERAMAAARADAEDPVGAVGG